MLTTKLYNAPTILNLQIIIVIDKRRSKIEFSFKNKWICDKKVESENKLKIFRVAEEKNSKLSDIKHS